MLSNAEGLNFWIVKYTTDVPELILIYLWEITCFRNYLLIDI